MPVLEKAETAWNKLNHGMLTYCGWDSKTSS
jgi:hypothetical protein